MAANRVLPSYFTKLSLARFFFSGLFIADAVIAGKLVKHLAGATALGELDALHLTHSHLLHAGAIVATTVIATAAVWAWANMFAETSHQSRRYALFYTYILDAFVASTCITAIAFEKIALRGGYCKGKSVVRPLPATIAAPFVGPLDGLCHSLEIYFRLLVATLVFHTFTVFVTTRYYFHTRLANSRADADDWTKNRSAHVVPVMKGLQLLAAPFRFVWRCFCKFCHATENPLKWIIVVLLLSIPLLLMFAYDILKRIIKRAIFGVRAIQAKRDQSPSLSADTLATIDLGILNGAAEQDHSIPLAELTSVHTGPPIASPTPAPREVSWWKIKRSKPIPLPPGTSSLEHLLCHPDLFFSLISHLHGADLRALKDVSRLTRASINGYKKTYPKAVMECICSRRSRRELLFAALLETPLDPVEEDGTETADAAAAPEPTTSPVNKECWSCGIMTCRSCHRERDVRLSKTEIRLRSLAPVCSTCYFKCLCYPKGCFRSMSEKCACTADFPPKNKRSLCRDCQALGYTDWWEKRLRRGAELDVGDLDAFAGWDTWLSMQRMVDAEQEQAQAADASPPPAHAPPRMATHAKTCYCCSARLWWFFGKSRGLRWWRCLKCGLEARDVLMSSAREFT